MNVKVVCIGLARAYQFATIDAEPVSRETHRPVLEGSRHLANLVRFLLLHKPHNQGQ